MERTLGMHWGGANRQDLHRFLKLSAVFHALGLLLLIFVPTLPKLAAPGVIMVDLVASSSLGAVRRGPSAPKPKPKPPKQAPKILPTEPTTPEPSAQPKPSPPEEEAPEDYTDILAELRAELGELDVVPENEPVQTASLGGGFGPGRPVSPVVAAWIKATRIHIRKFWVVPPGFRNQSLETVIEVELARRRRACVFTRRSRPEYTPQGQSLTSPFATPRTRGSDHPPWTSSRAITSPLRTFGSNQVDLGGICRF